MNFDDFDPKMGWDSDEDDILNDFYKPALLRSVKYQRLAGYFSSTTFAVAIREAIDFIQRGGIMQLVTSTDLSKQDVETIQRSIEDREKILAENLLGKITNNQDEVLAKCTSIMGWMLSHEIDGKPQLEIKIAIPHTPEEKDSPTSIYHQKVGIMFDEKGRTISFSGSVNETGKAWKDNVEEFKVFKSRGDKTNQNAVEIDRETFNKFWNKHATRTTVYDLPHAVREHLIKIRPRSTQEFEETINDIKNSLDEANARIRLYRYQQKAIGLWIQNQYRGLIEMATGTGKTFTALGCINKIQQEKKRFVVIIASPQKHLVDQWVESIIDWNSGVEKKSIVKDSPSVQCFSDNKNWRSDLETQIRNFNKKLFSGEFLSNRFVVHTTHDTLSNPEFIEKMSRVGNEVLLIVDEVHAIGSEKMQSSLSNTYNYRLGLSATPLRHYDPEGSNIILNYFGGVVYRLGIEDAIKKGYLVPYDYLPFYTELNQEEMADYRQLTRAIARKYSKKPDEIEGGFNSFAENERANLIANAEGKYRILEEILNSKNNRLKDTLIYCHDRQIDRVSRMLTQRNIVSDSITWEDPTSDRLKIIRNLSDHHFDCITAIKCLDEGVDIPSATIAIIMASTGNPRQYIQRRGRVLRRNDKTNKNKAIIYDILVKPPLVEDAQDITRMERKLVARELLRHKEFALIALNRDDAIERIRQVAETYVIDFDNLSDDYINSL